MCIDDNGYDGSYGLYVQQWHFQEGDSIDEKSHTINEDGHCRALFVYLWLNKVLANVA